MSLGIAIADLIVEEAQKTWTDEQIEKAKAAWREMILALNNTIRERNDLIEIIRRMPEGREKRGAIASFIETDSILFSALQKVKPIIDKVTKYTGDTVLTPRDATFKALLPVIPLSVWALVAASAATIGYVTTQLYEIKKKYEVIKEKPELAKYLESDGILSKIGEGVGKSLTILALILGFAGAIYIIKKRG